MKATAAGTVILVIWVVSAVSVAEGRLATVPGVTWSRVFTLEDHAVFEPASVWGLWSQILVTNLFRITYLLHIGADTGGQLTHRVIRISQDSYHK